MKKLVILLLLAVGGVAYAQEAPVQVDPSVEAARKACTEAMNKDPSFAKSIIDTVDKQADQRTLDAHLDAAKHVAENEQHVIAAYIAMWIIAALFVVFLWRRQQGLKLEIAQLRRDLDAAGKESK
ncbi:MAG: hypothetical protein HOV81_39155 [Kofleriaceae bacterium]|nr:hypothetical protein [Kofleriaceae bacterium]